MLCFALKFAFGDWQYCFQSEMVQIYLKFNYAILWRCSHASK